MWGWELPPELWGWELPPELWGCPVFWFTSNASIDKSPPTFLKFAKLTLFAVVFEPVPVTFTLPTTVPSVVIETSFELTDKFPSTLVHLFAENVPAVMDAFPPIVVRLFALNVPETSADIANGPFTAVVAIERFVAFGAIIDNDGSGNGYKSSILVATGAINDLISMPGPKEIELTANAVKSKIPIVEFGLILKPEQTARLIKFIDIAPRFLDALEVTGVNKMLPTEVRLGIS